MIKNVCGFRATHLLYAVAFVVLFVPAGWSYASATSVSSDASLSNDLISYWPLDESSGTRVDVKGSNDLAEINTVGSTTGIKGTAADFEGSNSENLAISNAAQSGLNITGDLSFSMWIKPETFDSGDGQLLLSKWQHNASNQYFVYLTDSSLGVYMDDDCTGYSYVIRTWNHSMVAGNWYHVAVVYNASSGSAEAFVNNSSLGTITGLPHSIAGCSAAFELGLRDTPYLPSSYYFDGAMDEVGIWNKDLTTTDIANLYNNGGGIPYEASSSTASSTTATGSTVRKSADESVTASTALQDDNDLSVTLAPSTEYTIDAFIVATTTSKKPDLKLSFTAPAGSEILVGYLAYTGMSPAGGGILESSGTASDKILLSPAESTVIHVVGTIKTGSNDGQLTLQWAQNASDSAGVTVRKGSYLKAEQI